MKDTASNNYVQYVAEKRNLRERYAGMGMLNSGAYKAALESLDRQYQLSSQSLSKDIDEIEEQIAYLEAEEANPSVENILAQLAQNNNMTYEEAVRKYNKYIA